MFTQASQASSQRFGSTMRLHHILQDYKHTEQHRSTLENKLTVIKHHYDSNRKKAKNIQSSILKIQDIKHHYRREKQEIAHLLSQEKENQNRKIAREREKRENNRENITIIHNMIIQEKQKDYFKIKDSEQTNQLRITQNLKTSLHEKRQKSLEVKLKEEESKLAKTIFLEKKRLRAQRDIENEMAPLELGKSMNQKYLSQMRELQEEMTMKLQQSREVLSKSKLTLIAIH